MVAFNYDVLRTDNNNPVFIHVRNATRGYLEMLLVQHTVNSHKPQHPRFSLYLNHGMCKLDFRFFLYCTVRQQTFPESQLLEAWPASIYGHLREGYLSGTLTGIELG